MLIEIELCAKSAVSSLSGVVKYWSLTGFYIWFYIFKWYSGRGEMCAMKEVALVSDDAKSKESAKQLMQVSTFEFWQSFHQPSSFNFFLLPLWTVVICCSYFDILWKKFHTFSALTGNCCAKPIAASKYCTILWIWNGMSYVC